jgi:hypothetical protein
MLAILQQFYQDAYTRLRKRVDPTVAIVFHDSFRPRPLDWKNFMQVPAFVNVILDTHLYQCFGKQDKLARRGNNSNFPLTAKESLTRCNAKNCPPSSANGRWHCPARICWTPLQVASVKRAYADTQLLNYEGTRGWFFWSYKLEYPSEWNFRYSAERGWLPESFAV